MKKQQKITSVIVLIVITLYALQAIYTHVMKVPQIAIIGYHHIVPDEDKTAYYKHNMWVNSLSSFERQMQYLYDEGYQSITLDELYDWYCGTITLPEKSVVITFDDGFYSSIQFAQPVMAQYGFTGSVFVIGSLIDENRTDYIADKRQHASTEDMQNNIGLKFYAHSYDLHKKTPDFKVDILTKDALTADTLKEKDNVDITYYAYPYGHYNPMIQKVLKEQGVQLAFGYNENRKARLDDDRYAIPRFNVNAYTRLDVFAQMVK